MTTTTTSLDFEGLMPPAYLALLVAGIVALVVLAYLRTFRPYGPRFIALLVALRLLAVAFLILSLAKPIWRIQTTRYEQGKVAIIFDNTLSMTHRSSQETRYQTLEQLLRGQLLPALKRKNDVRLYDMTGQPSPGLPPAPTLTRTDIGRAVQEVVQHLKNDLVAGLVLVTDGTDTTGQDVAEQIGGVRFPIFAVGLGDPQTADRLGGEVQVAGVTASRRVLADNATTVKVRLVNRGIEESNVPVKLYCGKSLAAEPVVVHLKPNQEESTLELKFTPSTPGHYVYSAMVSPRHEGDRLDNNVWHFPVTVRGKMIRVMYVEGALRWESKFLRRALKDDPDIVIQSFTRTGPRTEWKGKDVKGLRGNIFRPDVLKNFDVVVIGEIEADYFTPAELNALADFVEREAGGGLCLLGGYLSFGSQGFTKSRLVQVLPAVFPEGERNQIEHPFQMALTAEGLESPIFRVRDNEADNAAFWKALPPLDGCTKILRAKKGATVLAVNPTVDTAGGKMPVAVTQRYGNGRVMLFTPDTSWKWRQALVAAGLDVTAYNRFWSQMIRWLAGTDPALDKPLVEIVTDKFKYASQEPVRVRVTVRPSDKDDKEGGPVRPVAYASCGGVVYADVALEPVPGNPNEFTGSFVPHPGGRHVCTVEGQRGGKMVELRQAEFVVDEPNVEMERLRPDHRLLEELARRTGGGFYTAANAADLAARIRPLERTTKLPEVRERLWNSPLFFACFLGCIFTEWFLRRRRRMA